MVRRVVYRALDGHRVMLAGELDLSRPWTSTVLCRVDGRLHELTSGNHTFAAAWGRDLEVRWEEDYAVRGGWLRVGTATDRDRTTGLAEPLLAAAWHGRRHSLVTHCHHARSLDVVRLFDALRIREYADGVAVTTRPDEAGPRTWGPGRTREEARGPDRRAGADAVAGADTGVDAAAPVLGPRTRPVLVHPARIVKEIPGLGLLEISLLDRRTRRRFPPWRGARVPGGELFRDVAEGEGVYFVLVTGTAMVTILPFDPALKRAPELLNRLFVEVIRTGQDGQPHHGVGAGEGAAAGLGPARRIRARPPVGAGHDAAASVAAPDAVAGHHGGPPGGVPRAVPDGPLGGAPGMCSEVASGASADAAPEMSSDAAPGISPDGAPGTSADGAPGTSPAPTSGDGHPGRRARIPRPRRAAR